MKRTGCKSPRRPRAAAGLLLCLPFAPAWGQEGCPDCPEACGDCRSGTIACGETVAGDLATDHCQSHLGSPFQVWRLDVAEARDVAIELRSSGFETYLEIGDGRCEWLGATIGSVLFLRLQAGTYFVSAGALLAAPGEAGAYELEVRCLERCRDCISQPLACGETVEEILPVNDVCSLEDGSFFDIYPFHLEEAARVDVSLESLEFEPSLILRDDRCRIVEHINTECGADGICLGAALPPGEYSIVATSWLGPATGRYSVSLQCTSPDNDPACGACLVGDLPLNGSVSGDFEFPFACLPPDSLPDDILETYRLEVPEPSAVEIELTSNALERVTPRLTLNDDACLPLAITPECSSEEDPCLLAVDLEAGTYFVGVHFFPPADRGRYSLDVRYSPRMHPPPRFIRGDCDGDGQATGRVTDAVFLLEYNFRGGPRPPCLAACDADGDGLTEGQVTDAVYMLQHNFRGGPPPPPPFPACGAGALGTDEVLGCEAPPEGCVSP